MEKGDEKVSLYVDIEKKLGGFYLQSKFEIENEILGILGASGCGKSITLKCIAGIENPDRGKIILDGEVIFDSENNINIHPRLRKTGYLFQNYALFPNMTVEENIACGVSKSKRVNKIVEENIRRFCLNGLEKLYPGQLSGGQQQRVAIARMLAAEPKILMFDEPFSALDSFLKVQLEYELINVLEEFKGTTLYVSHDRDEVYRICKKILVLDSGRTEMVRGKEELLSHPKTLSETLLTGCENISSAEKINNHSLKAVDWGIILYSSEIIPDDLKYVGFHAHSFKMVDNLQQENVIDCNILKIVENIFYNTIIFRNKENSSTNKWSYLRFKIDKNKWNEMQKKNKLCLKMPSDKLILI